MLNGLPLNFDILTPPTIMTPMKIICDKKCKYYLTSR